MKKYQIEVNVCECSCLLQFFVNAWTQKRHRSIKSHQYICWMKTLRCRIDKKQTHTFQTWVILSLKRSFRFHHCNESVILIQEFLSATHSNSDFTFDPNFSHPLSFSYSSIRSSSLTLNLTRNTVLNMLFRRKSLQMGNVLIISLTICFDILMGIGW